MFAVKILSETWGLILEQDLIPPTEIEAIKRYYLDKEYVILRGSVDERGDIVPYIIMPLNVFTKNYDYDPVAIQHDWDLVVKPIDDDYPQRRPYKD